MSHSVRNFDITLLHTSMMLGTSDISHYGNVKHYYCINVCLIADEGDDFLGIEGKELIFSRDTRTLCFNVTILNDGDCEGLEFFSLSLTSSQQRVVVAPSTGYVIISDPPLCSRFALKPFGRHGDVLK